MLQEAEVFSGDDDRLHTQVDLGEGFFVNAIV
jgi:hypothetical protein